MRVVSWRDSYSVGIDIFDKHHIILIQLINILYDVLNSSVDREVIDAIYDELINYVKYHFSEEENFLDKNGYPGIVIHKREHVKFVKFIKDSKKDLNESGYLLSTIELFNFLREWLIEHILSTDMKYYDFFKKEGII